MQRFHSARRRVFAALTVLVMACVATAGIAAPGYAAGPTRWGFAFVDDPTVPMWTALHPAFQATSVASAGVTGGTLGPGDFQVRFPGIGVASRGAVHVTAVSNTGNYCETVRWFVTSGPDEVVEVQCFAPGGIPADTPFTVLWALTTATLPSPTGSYASVTYRTGFGVAEQYNSMGTGVTATAAGTGIVQVLFAKVGVSGVGRTGNLQVTALSAARDPRWCKIGSWDASNTDMFANVYCFDAAGHLTDTSFIASYHRERSVLTVFGPPKYLGYVWSSATGTVGSPQTNYNVAGGGYGLNPVTYPFGGIQVKFPGLAVDATHVQVTAIGSDPNYCTIPKRWLVSGSDVYVHALCFDPTGAVVPEDAFITLTNRS